jgi:hypothetical protein
MLPDNLAPYRCSRGTVVEIPRADIESVTFALDLSFKGMMMVVR